MDEMVKQYEREQAIERFKEITQDMKDSDIRIPSIDRITTFNDKNVIINFFDKFVTVYEVMTFEADEEEQNTLAAVALGRYEGGGKLTLIDFRFIGTEESETFKEGINAFLEMVDKTRMEELPPTELHEGGDMTYEEIINKIATTYVLSAEMVTIH